MNIRVPVGALLSLGLLGGCVTQGRFVRTDPTFREAQSLQDPAVFVDRKPPQPYRTVGVIEVTLDANASVDTIRAAIIPKGRRVGCDVLVEWATHQKVSAAPRAPDGTLMALVHDGDGVRNSSPGEGGSFTPQRTYRFACGLIAVVQPASPVAS